MTFLNILVATEILCSFKLLLEEKTSKEMPKSSESKFLEKVSVKSFALSDAEDNTFVKWKTYSRFIFVQNTISNSPEVSRAKFLESNFVLFLHNFFFFFFFARCKFGSFKNPFETITSLSELYFRTRGFIFLVQTKKVIFMNYETSASS